MTEEKWQILVNKNRNGTLLQPADIKAYLDEKHRRNFEPLKEKPHGRNQNEPRQD